MNKKKVFLTITVYDDASIDFDFAKPLSEAEIVGILEKIKYQMFKKDHEIIS